MVFKILPRRALRRDDRDARPKRFGDDDAEVLGVGRENEEVGARVRLPLLIVVEGTGKDKVGVGSWSGRMDSAVVILIGHAEGEDAVLNLLLVGEFFRSALGVNEFANPTFGLNSRPRLDQFHHALLRMHAADE